MNLKWLWRLYIRGSVVPLIPDPISWLQPACLTCWTGVTATSVSMWVWMFKKRRPLSSKHVSHRLLSSQSLVKLEISESLLKSKQCVNSSFVEVETWCDAPVRCSTRPIRSRTQLSVMTICAIISSRRRKSEHSSAQWEERQQFCKKQSLFISVILLDFDIKNKCPSLCLWLYCFGTHVICGSTNGLILAWRERICLTKY